MTKPTPETAPRAARAATRAAATVLLAAALAGGCLDSGGKGTGSDPCGAGDAFSAEGVGYCIFTAAIIIEGFDCPAAAPFRFEGSDGTVVCSPSEAPPTGGVDGLIDDWREQTGQPKPDTVGGDTLSPGDTAGDTDTTPPGPLSACEQGLADAGVGSAFTAPDHSGCTVARACAEGAVGALLTCADGGVYCDCEHGELRCVALAGGSCPARGGGTGTACLPALGASACGGGLWCEDGVCAAPPALCAGGCYRAVDCGAGSACVGGEAGTGTIGACRAAVATGACWSAADCASGFACQGATSCVGCEACPGATPGACQAGGGTTLGVVAGDGFAVDVWWQVGDAYAGLPCPAFALEVRDEATGEWVAGPSDATCTAGAAAFGLDVRSAGAVTPTEGFDYAWVRARGSYYTGCFGAVPESCTGEPVELVSEPVLVAP
ncbi:MAG: hypothetical protein H6745_29910 [Deltaproteobacteria bacterium]|nr:hypothetical protein [Deltaproteobacteria bacterium]